jgi:hypothetical protein
MNNCCNVMVNFQSQLPERTAQQDNYLGLVFFKK